MNEGPSHGSRQKAIAAAVLLAVVLSAVSACRSADPACAGRNAADVAPSAAAFRAMTPAERRTEAAAFNALARRCGWEP